jgi:phenylalanyl-tRNA synthetase beta chain
LTGSGRHWSEKDEPASVFDVKADVFAALQALGIDPAKAQITRDCPKWYHPGRSGTLRMGPKTILAHFGDVHPATLKALDVEAPVAAFEIFLDALPPEKKKSRARTVLAASDLLPVKRDLAFVVPKDVAAGDLVKAAANADKALIRAVSVFDVFEGGALAAEGKKSVAIEVTIQPSDETLTDEAIETITQKIVSDVKKATGGELRS